MYSLIVMFQSNTFAVLAEFKNPILVTSWTACARGSIVSDRKLGRIP